MESLRVLEYITPSSMGGAEHTVLRLGRELTRRGHQITFLCPRGRALTGELKAAGFDVWAPRTRGKLDPITLMRVVHYVRREGVQVIHTHLSTASLLGGLAARIAGVPSFASVQGLNSAFAYRYSDRLLPVSQAVRGHLSAQGLPEERMEVIPNGVDLRHFDRVMQSSEAREQLKFEAGAPLLLYTGRLSPEKGVLDLPAILDAVRREITDAHLLVLGEGLLREELTSAFEKRGLTDAVTMAGYSTDTRPYLAAADLLIAPSYKEGLPLAVLEAMAAGLPVVAARAGGMAEVVAQGETGELVDSGDTESAARAAVAILSDEGLRARLGSAGRRRVESLFSFEHSVDQLERAFWREINRSSPATRPGNSPVSGEQA